MDENDISTHIQNGHTTPFTDQTVSMVKRTAKSDCEHSNKQNTLFTNSIQLSEESHREPISRDEIVPSGTHTSTNTNLTRISSEVNFDLYSVETHFGKVPWRPIEATFVILEENGTKICVLQPASYSIDVMLNLDNRRNKDQVTVSVCILNSRDTGNRCIPEVLSSHMQRSVTASVNLNLQKSDAIWVSVIGLNLVYERADVNSMSIRKYDT
ncbi:unnamed protein product [Mytilus edulis]|uniref:Uncharacterized protein n=1 Tax=Mytilus edulis TaxID=6550 RepID=A0A8S3PWQ3_MYTED|nr:unnamed protein product [Mytilus edulis]